jgi:flagellar hook protein FlgE
MRFVLISAVVLAGCGAADSAQQPQAFEQDCAMLGADAFQQGRLATTGLATDFALDGPGFFVLEDELGQWFTREGRFALDEQGRFVHRASGAHLMDANGEALTLGLQVLPPKETSTLELQANLDAREPIQVFDPSDPAGTSSMQSTLTVFDALGTANAVDVFWTLIAPGAWEFHAMVDGQSVSGGTSGVPTEIANGTLTFDTRGRLDTVTQTSHFTPSNMTSPQLLQFDFGDDLASGGTGLRGLTQFASPGSTMRASQDGWPAGVLINFQMEYGGALVGAYTNGRTVTLGHVATAIFNAPQALRQRANKLYVATVGSGQAFIGPAGSTVQPHIVAGALESLPVCSK